MQFSKVFVSLALAVALASALPVDSIAPRAIDSQTLLSNGQQAQSENSIFSQMSPDDGSCTPDREGAQVCIHDQFGLCNNGHYVLTPCGAGTVCRSIPETSEPGTIITCITEAEAEARIAASGATGGIDG